MFDLIKKYLDALRPFAASPSGDDSGGEYVRWGGARLDARQNMHYCLVGTTRSGKTTLLRILLQDALLPMLAGADIRAVLYDPKHEMHRVLGGLGLGDRAITLAPFSTQSSSWALCRDIADDRGASEVANIFVPEERGKDGVESFFTTALRNLVTCVLKSFQRSGCEWSLRDVLHAFGDLELLQAVVVRYEDLDQSVRNTLQRAETIQDLVSTIENFRNQYTVIAALWHRAELQGRLFSIREFILSNKILVMPGPSQPGDPVAVLNQVIFHRLVDEVLGLPEPSRSVVDQRRIWIFIDELRTAGELVGLERLLSKSASKGCRVVLGVQAIEGLRDAQGENRAEELLGLCHNRAFLRAPSGATAEWMSRQLQSKQASVEEKSRTRTDQGESTTWTTRQMERPQVSPRAFLELGSPEWSDELEGVFVAPGLERPFYHASVTATRLFGGMNPLVVPLGDEAAAESKRAPEEQRLLPWGLDDLHRLGLPPYLIGRLRSGEFPQVSAKWKNL